LQSSFWQIGNVAIFLERGNDTDHYDFLDLYTRRWLKTERAVFQACRARNMTPSSRRRGTATGTDDDIHELSTRQTAGGLPQWLSKPFFNRSYHPYDWYVKSGTEVSARCDSKYTTKATSRSHFLLSITSDTRVQWPSLRALTRCTGGF
jgi:hypothetical protein